MQMETPAPPTGIALGALMYPLGAGYVHTDKNFEWIKKNYPRKEVQPDYPPECCTLLPAFGVCYDCDLAQAFICFLEEKHHNKERGSLNSESSRVR